MFNIGKFYPKYEADLNLEHDDHMTLIEDVAWSVDGHPWEVLDLLWIPAKQHENTLGMFN